MRQFTLRTSAVALACAFLAAGCEGRRFPTVAGTGESVIDTSTSPPTPPPQQPILITPLQANLRLGDTLRISTAGVSAGTPLQWNSSQQGVVVIQSTTSTTALVRGVGTGNASVSVQVVGDSTRRAAATITVVP